MDLRLSSGDRVCIVGGGPAGSFAALHLHHFARQHGLRLEVLVFEPRDFSQPGPAGCNRCAGILSSRLLRGMESLGLVLPPEVVQDELHAYTVWVDRESFRIERPDPGRRIVSIYRGGGPRLLQGAPVASFDRYLLSQACARGAQHISTRVRRVSWEDRPVVETADGRFPADLLVLATGVNSRAPLSPEYGYKPPQTEVMAQDEMTRPATWPQDQVSVYFREPPGLIFGALIPKGQYVNISLLGRGLTRDTVSEFLEAQGLEPSLGSSGSLCGCTPRVAVRPADIYFGTRWVAVGDAAVTRLYKDGIGSAFYTAQRAMQVAVQRGVSGNAFRKWYAPLCRSVARDNTYGRLLFRMWSYTLHTPQLLRAWTNVVRREASWPPVCLSVYLPVCLSADEAGRRGRPTRQADEAGRQGRPDRRVHIRILWGMFTGDDLYRDLFWLSLSPRALYGLVRGWWSSE